MSDDLVLDLEKLKVETIRGVVLVDSVNATLKRGEILGLIGESGAGKSTIGLAAMAYARAGCRITDGAIKINGTELRASTAAQRRNFRGPRRKPTRCGCSARCSCPIPTRSAIAIRTKSPAASSSARWPPWP
jgi:ABC-type antimicrobial peptide transport system ATPase subunit